MLMLACILVFLSISLMMGSFGAHLVFAPRRAAIGRLHALKSTQPTTYDETLVTSEASVTAAGLSPETHSGALLLNAGFRSNSTLRAYQLSRLGCALVLACIPVLLSTRQAISPEAAFLLLTSLLLTGYMLPRVYLTMKARRRQHRLRLSLPDALDLLVVCVEAGMGLNQAIVRVSEELVGTHPEIADEFKMVNLEIRAGRTRPEALRALGERTGVDDIISLAAMIIQTDRFGTSIARSLRVHSDSLRTERRQRAEEAAAKTTIKLIFPLLFCIFPSLFVTILGPAALHLAKIFGGMAK